jgi:hypothetical protein
MCFLGYSPMHKGVKFLDIKTGQVYISRDVVFDETMFPFSSLHPNAGALLRQEILLLPESLQTHPVSSQEGEKHCTELTPNDSIIPVSSNSTQVHQHAGENCTQNGEEMRQNEAGLHHHMSGARHEAYQPRIGETPRSLGESTPGSMRALEETAQASENSSRSACGESSSGAASGAGPGVGPSESSIDMRRNVVRRAARASPGQSAGGVWQEPARGTRRGTAESPTRSSARQDAGISAAPGSSVPDPAAFPPATTA